MTQKRKAYEIVKHQYITEKTSVLSGLETAESNPSLKKCQSPKAVFIVDRDANKYEIADAIEEIYSNRGVKVEKVNTLIVKPKPRRVRGREGFKKAVKKAIVTFRVGDKLDNV